MIKKTYTLTYKTSPFKSKLKSVKDPSCADLYLNKLQGWFDLGVIAKILGHRDISMLVEVYGHTLEEKIFEEFNQIRDIWKDCS